MVVRFAVASSLAALFAVSAAAEPAEPPEHPGEAYFRQYCASCHGLGADGKGPVAPTLRSQPADLTRLAEKYGDPLPRAAIRDFIDGEAMPRSHGSSDMPVWGRVLRAELSPDESNTAIRRMVLSLIVDYLAEIQMEPPAKP